MFKLALVIAVGVFGFFSFAAYAIAPLVALSFTASTGASVASTATATVIGLALTALAFFSASTNNSVDYYIQPSFNAAPQLREAPPLDAWNPATDKPSGSVCIRSRYFYTTDTTTERKVITAMELQHLSTVSCTATYQKKFACSLTSGYYTCEMNFVSTRLADQTYRFNVDGQFQSIIRATKAGAVASDDAVDNQMEFVRDTSTGEFAQPFDPDYIQGTSEPNRPVWNTGKIYSSSTTSENKQSTTVISARPDGGTDIITHIQEEPGLVRSFNTQISPSSVVQSASSSYSAGSVQPASSIQPGVEFVPVSSASSSPSPDPGTGTTVQFPSDYARAGEAAAAAQIVSDNLLQGEVVTPTVSDSEMPWFGDTFDGLSAFQINTTGATCPVWQFDALDKNFYIDHHCTLIQDFNALFYAMFTAFWVLLAIRTVMEA